MHNISSELKVVPGNRCIRVAIEWFVSYLWLLCCSPSIFLSLLYLKKRKNNRKKKKQTKRKKKKKLNLKDKIIVRRTSK